MHSGGKAARRAERMETGRWIGSLIRQGLTLKEIGSGLGVSRERVRQLLKASGGTVWDYKPKKPDKKQSAQSRLAKRRERLASGFLRRAVEESGCRSGMDTPCWRWTGYSRQIQRCREGYRIPIMTGPRNDMADRRVASVPAYRVAYILFKGPIPREPKRMAVDHICFNPMCVNPDHLQLLTNSENSARKGPRGREASRQNIDHARACRRHKMSTVSNGAPLK